MDVKNVVMSACFGLLGALIFTLFNQYYNSTTFGVVSLDTVIGAHIAKYGAESMTEDELSEQSALFASALQSKISELSERGVILLVAPAVVSDLHDYTSEVKEGIEVILNANE